MEKTLTKDRLTLFYNLNYWTNTSQWYHIRLIHSQIFSSLIVIFPSFPIKCKLTNSKSPSNYIHDWLKYSIQTLLAEMLNFLKEASELFRDVVSTLHAAWWSEFDKLCIKINDLEEMLAETCLLRVWNTLKWLGFSVYK